MNTEIDGAFGPLYDAIGKEAQANGKEDASGMRRYVAKCMASNDFTGSGRAMGCSAARAWEVWCAASAAFGLPPPPRPEVATGARVIDVTCDSDIDASLADVTWTPAGLGSVQWHSVVGIARQPRTMLKGRWRR